MSSTKTALPWKSEQSYAKLPSPCLSKVKPTPVAAPRLIALLEQHRLDFTNSFRALAGDDNDEQHALAQADFSALRERLDQCLSGSDPITLPSEGQS